MRDAAGRRSGRGQRRRRGAADRRRRQGDRLRRRAEPRLHASRTATRRFNPLTLVEGAWPGGRRGRDRQVDGRQGGLRGRRDDRRPGRGPGRAAADLRASSSSARSRRSAARRSPASTCPTAQQLFDKAGKLDEIAVAAEARRQRPEQLVQADRADPARRRAQVRPAPQQATEDARGHERVHHASSGASCSRSAGIALFVGSFVIANSLSITIAQRTREFATLRTLGASRRQVLGSIVIEALVVGVARVGRSGSSLGLALAKGLFCALRRGRLHAAEQRAALRDADDRRRRCSSASS